METKTRSLSGASHNLNSYIILALISLLYLPILWHWVDGWLNKSIGIEHEYYSHALLGFPLAMYIVWQQRDQWRNLPSVMQPAGGVLLLIAGYLYLTGISNLVFLSFPLLLTGVCLWLKGMPGLKLQFFPLLLVWLGTPTSIPYLISNYTVPLQKLIASLVGLLITPLGFQVTVQDIYVLVDEKVVEIAPYCAGLKMLFASLYVALMFLYWRGQLKSRQVTTIVLTSTIVISVVGNILRNTLLAIFLATERDHLFELLHEGWLGDIYSGITLVIVFFLIKVLEKRKIA